MKDNYGRDINYMRISITDRCNLRCRYCMPPEGIPKVSMSEILTYEEILQICRAATDLGITRFKVTGGEPLARKGCVSFCKELKELPGVEQVTLTTNGQLLAGCAEAFRDAGLDGINISLDSLREDRYRFITGGGELSATLEGIDAAIAAGLNVKINCLLQKEFNEDELEDFAAIAFDKGIDVRFIEIMPIGFGEPDTGLSNEDVLRRLQSLYPALSRDTRVHGNGPAVYYRLPGAGGAVGLISAMHASFCGSCNRVRLTSRGQLKPCLCYEDSTDLKPVLRGENDARLRQALKEAVLGKPAGHTFYDRASVEHRAMMEIGG